MLFSPDISSSGSSGSEDTGVSQYEKEDPSILWMLKELDITGRYEPKALPTFEAPSLEAYLPKFLQQGESKDFSETHGVIVRSFLRGQSQWVDEPVITRWRSSSFELRTKLEMVDRLYQRWSQSKPTPFDPFFDRIWLETAAAIKDAGLPWHTNNLNMPEEMDASWPFHFKSFERIAVLEKGRRVSDPDASGYITNWIEGNYYGIRALKQELLRQCSMRQPVLLTHHFESELAEMASRLFGLEWHKIILGDPDELHSRVSSLTSNGERPIIFAATLANTKGESDDVNIIDSISKRFPLMLHLDACRVFDYITTMGDKLRRLLRLPRLRLHHSQLGEPGCILDGEICASTIVAGGSNAYVFPPPVVVLKPKLLGNQAPATVEYVRGTDGTLAGSRDSLGPLMLCLQELRFGPSGLRDIYELCALKRLRLMDELRAMNVSFSAHAAALDLTIDISCASTAQKLTELGAKVLGGGKLLLTVQPSAQLQDFKSLLGLFGSIELSRPTQHILSQPSSSTYTLPDGVAKKMWDAVQTFKIAARSSCGYPLNQATYSALGPAIGPFLTVKIPQEWSRVQATKILSKRMQAFGLLTPESQEPFRACFTTGSTMGNRIGIQNALAQCPGAFVYFSSASHYSVKKTVSDCDDLSSRWRPGKIPHFTEIPADEYGRMIPQALVQQVLSDRSECITRHELYRMIIFANLGTTFVGGQDNLVEIGKQLAGIEANPFYIHVDGALDLGFLAEGIRLGPPGALSTNEGVPIVQGLTLSHHKAFGIMVSGEVIGYCPNSSEQFTSVTSSIDPRAVFETWLFQHIYSQDDLASIWQYCLENTSLLRRLLGKVNVPTRFNEKCIITLLERPPPWVVKDFQLAPEGDWVHFITMPHVSPATIKHFARTIALIDIHCATAFSYVRDSLNTCLYRSVKLQRLTCRSSYVSKVLHITKKTILADSKCQKMGDELGLTQATQIWARYICGAMSFIAVDDEGEVLAVFFAEADQKRVVKPSILLFRSTFHQEVHMLRDVGIQLFGHIATLVDVSIQTTWCSYRTIQYTTDV